MLDLLEGKFGFVDCGRETISGTQRLAAAMTFRAGEVVCNPNGLGLPHWKPATNRARAVGVAGAFDLGPRRVFLRLLNGYVISRCMPTSFGVTKSVRSPMSFRLLERTMRPWSLMERSASRGGTS